MYTESSRASDILVQYKRQLILRIWKFGKKVPIISDNRRQRIIVQEHGISQFSRFESSLDCMKLLTCVLGARAVLSQLEIESLPSIESVCCRAYSRVVYMATTNSHLVQVRATAHVGVV